MLEKKLQRHFSLTFEVPSVRLKDEEKCSEGGLHRFSFGVAKSAKICLSRCTVKRIKTVCKSKLVA